MAIDKIFYNQASAQKLGWKPSWFGCSDFNDELIQKISEFQKANKLVVDGCCGPLTFKKIFTEHEAKLHLIQHQLENKVIDVPPKQHLIQVGWQGLTIPIKWDKFVGLSDVGNLALPPNTYKTVNYERKPQFFCLHHDVALSAKSCHDVLVGRGLSVQFMIDNDGTIYQGTPLNASAQQAGKLNDVSFNMLSVGVEISNAIELKYQGHYKIKGLDARPIIRKFKCHKKNYGDVLGMYPIQIEALKALLKAVCSYYNIPFEIPRDDKGNMLMDISKECQEGKFRGICAHWNLDKDKWDPVGVDFKSIVDELKKG